MIVVSDTTAITNLYQVGLLELVRRIYREFHIPESVYNELGKLPAQTRFVDSNTWIKVRKVNNRELVDELLSRLDPGESEAIALALELGADILIIDEYLGRSVAKEYGLTIIGLLGILVSAKRRGHLKLVKPVLFDLTEKHGYRVSESLLRSILEIVGEK